MAEASVRRQYSACGRDRRSALTRLTRRHRLYSTGRAWSCSTKASSGYRVELATWAATDERCRLGRLVEFDNDGKGDGHDDAGCDRGDVRKQRDGDSREGRRGVLTRYSTNAENRSLSFLASAPKDVRPAIKEEKVVRLQN
jgi:hypothetical protein